MEEKKVEEPKTVQTKKETIDNENRDNIKPIECLNKKLDPNYHQAMMEIEDGQKEPGTIMQEIQKGFTIKDRLLRPSLVGVSKKTEEKNKESTKNEENKVIRPHKSFRLMGKTTKLLYMV